MEPSTELLLLVTEEQAHAFDFKTRHRITVGRHESNDLQLASRTVSNFHAEIVKEGTSIVLRDLGSTNGSFVGGQRIVNQTLTSGDRIRVGNHTFTIQLKQEADSLDGFVRYQRDSQAWGPGSKGRVVSLRARSSDAVKTLQVDDPNDLSLPDLLNRLGRSDASVCVQLTRENEACQVLASKNHVIHAELGESVGEKALYRVFCWQGCDYEVKSVIDNTLGLPRTIELPTETLIMEGMRQALELGKLIADLPPMGAELRLKQDCPLPITAHSPAEIDIYQAIIRKQTIGSVLQSSPLTDVRILKLIQSLLRKGVFEIARETPSFVETLFPGAS